MKFEFFNDTGKKVNIHPATLVAGCVVDEKPIEHLEIRVFDLPEGTYPSVKMWDHGSFMMIYVWGKKNEIDG